MKAKNNIVRYGKRALVKFLIALIVENWCFFQAIYKLKSVYPSVEDIDLFVGGLLEKPIFDMPYGPVFTQIMAESFYRWKFGDRLYYEFKDAGFSLGQYLH
mgnify:CR=1 FL=1